VDDLFWERVEVFEDSTGRTPFFEYFDQLSPTLQVKLRAIIAAILITGPSSFRTCAYWKPMRGELVGIHEIRFIGPGRIHHRVFCVISKSDGGESNETLVLLDGAFKRNGELLTRARYRQLADIYAAYRQRF
jgi:hypothetical protein